MSPLLAAPLLLAGVWVWRQAAPGRPHSVIVATALCCLAAGDAFTTAWAATAVTTDTGRLALLLADPLLWAALGTAAAGVISLLVLLDLMPDLTAALRPLYQRSSRATFGSARLAGTAEVRPLLARTDGIVLGEWREDFWSRPDTAPLLRWRGEGTLLTIAPPGKGKGVSAVGPNLISWPGSLVAIDPKGENAAVWAVSRRLLGQRTVILNPLGCPYPGPHSDRWNPLDTIFEGPDFQKGINVIVDALVIAEQGGTAHFTEITRTVLRGLIAEICVTETGARRALPSILDRVSEDNWDDWCEAALATPERAGRLPAMAAAVWSQVGDDERGSFFSTLVRQVEFMAEPGMAACLSGSDLTMVDLAGGELSVFLCLPPGDMERHGRWLRLVVSAAIETLMRRATRPREDVLFLLDEMSVLGRLDALLSPGGSGALTFGRSFGIKLWGILQNPAQLAAAYGPEGEKIWLGLASVLQVFGVSKADNLFAEAISHMVGETTVKPESESGGLLQPGRNTPSSPTKRPVLTSDEIRRLKPEEMLLFVDNIDMPVLCHRAVYHRRPEWRRRFARNPAVAPGIPQPFALDPGETPS
ncbi:type IV secretory system conjugative DNA transfer family protein [Telmatospirillum sp.]|uniref:type IV secretory system conjugative DNA transfer family protein n=1 Tax=Telmatospirillum sp. TaxID=2079197 RepID=UPI002852454A|nr:type IV secretory system conjugative DNA transfer family protein [Telmatospirillum sp.]MDR3440608.1 type IV secretory system conjugative DNA transfer family protein [Telmatospirillum sp.]